MCQMSEKELCKMIGNSVPVPMVGEILQEAMFAAGFDRCQKKVSLASWFQLDWLHRSAWLLRPTLNKNQVTVTLDMGPHEKIEGTCVSPDWLKRFLFCFPALMSLSVPQTVKFWLQLRRRRRRCRALCPLMPVRSEAHTDEANCCQHVYVAKLLAKERSPDFFGLEGMEDVYESTRNALLLPSQIKELSLVCLTQLKGLGCH